MGTTTGSGKLSGGRGLALMIAGVAILLIVIAVVLVLILAGGNDANMPATP